MSTKIANAHDLKTALQQVLTKASQPHPSREALASELEEIAKGLREGTPKAATIYDPAYVVHEDWRQDVHDLYSKVVDRTMKGFMTMDDASTSLSNMIHEWEHTNPTLAKEMQPVYEQLRKAVISLMTWKGNLGHALSKFHG